MGKSVADDGRIEIAMSYIDKTNFPYCSTVRDTGCWMTYHRATIKDNVTTCDEVSRFTSRSSVGKEDNLRGLRGNQIRRHQDFFNNIATSMIHAW